MPELLPAAFELGAAPAFFGLLPFFCARPAASVAGAVAGAEPAAPAFLVLTLMLSVWPSLSEKSRSGWSGRLLGASFSRETCLGGVGTVRRVPAPMPASGGLFVVAQGDVEVEGVAPHLETNPDEGVAA